MEAKKYNTEQDYWNDQEIVSFFADNAPSEYWLEFFNSLENRASVKVLDLGCGGGRNTSLLLEKGFDVNACDLHSEMVNATRKKAAAFLSGAEVESRIIRANMQELPYGDNTFDVVLANGVFHNVSSVQELQLAIAETSRVLKSKGNLCLNMFSADFVDPTLEEINSAGLYKTPNNIDMLLITSEDILKMLAECRILPDGEIFRYQTNVFTGVRSVLRGVFAKSI